MIYLDNAATTKPNFFRSDYKYFWLNSNASYHKTGDPVVLEEIRKKIKSCLGVKGGYVLFFRCATEAFQWLTSKFCVNEVWCSPYEHDSVYNISEVLNENSKAKYDIQEYSLYCHQLVNQITGDVWDIKQAKEKYVTKPNQFFGSDLTAAIGHVVLPNDLKDYCDALWFSGHKFYTEKNIGAMWISNRLGKYLKASKDPKNQYNLVHGTVDVAGAYMIADAMEWVSDNYNHGNSYYNSLLSFLHNSFIEANIEAYNICLNEKTRTHAINAIYLPNINADALQTYLDSKGIYIGVAHSACAGAEDYHVLEAMGYNKTIANQTIRVSFGIGDSNNDIEGIKDFVNEIKKFRELF